MPKSVPVPKTNFLDQPIPNASASDSRLSANKATDNGAKAREAKAPTYSKPNIQIINNQPMTSSLDVAEYFGKHHKNVLQRVQNLNKLNPEFGRLNFKPSKYIDKQGKLRPCFNMTKDGFLFIITRFKEKKANYYKIAYINRFNEIEASLKQKSCVSLTTPASSSEITKLLYIPADKWDSVEKECQDAFKDYLKAGGILANGDDHMKGVYHSIGMLLTMSFRLHTELWKQRKVQLEVQKMVKHN